MTNNISQMRSAVKKIAWGFLFIYLHINLGTLDILPDWAGFALIVSTLSVIALEEESAKLIRPFGIGLIVWHVIEWVLKIFGMQVYLNYVSIIPTVISIYFTFQLFTNLAGVAEKYSCPQAKKLLVLRTVNIIFTVANTFLLYFGIITEGGDVYMAIMVALIVAGLIIMLAILITLFSFASSLAHKEEEMNTMAPPTDMPAGAYVPLPSEEEKQ